MLWYTRGSDWYHQVPNHEHFSGQSLTPTLARDLTTPADL